MGVLTKAVGHLANDVSTAGLPALGTCSMHVTVAEDSFTVSIDDGAVNIGADSPEQTECDFTYALDQSSWDTFCSNPPPRAEKLGGELVAMKGSGHFPMSEDPVVFRSYLVPVLDEISGVSRMSV